MVLPQTRPQERAGARRGQPIIKRSLSKRTDAEIKARFLSVALEYERYFQNVRTSIRSLRLLHAVNDASIQAAEVIKRNSCGDHSEDPRAVRFPDPKQCGVSASDDTEFEKLYAGYCKDRKRDEYRAK
ncbi:hypothetical protein CH337_04090 [Rhodoblastus acidophilus]|nr:hypothetical protein CKO16_01740 [Rhodoblastus acidophilus]RAI23022.1 hypothetical protein CH337_04090 [Rhodoblastus acidophilus]